MVVKLKQNSSDFQAKTEAETFLLNHPPDPLLQPPLQLPLLLPDVLGQVALGPPPFLVGPRPVGAYHI